MRRILAAENDFVLLAAISVAYQIAANRRWQRRRIYLYVGDENARVKGKVSPREACCGLTSSKAKGFSSRGH